MSALSEKSKNVAKILRLHVLARSSAEVCSFWRAQSMSSFVAPGASSASGFFSASASSDGLDQTSVAERTAQAKALEQLLSTLLSAGYFRARVAALAPFDKLVGGLCWAISSSGAAVDVDLFYDEELALGAKMFVLRLVQSTTTLASAL